jgi:CHASE3 domain sensor protein
MKIRTQLITGFSLLAVVMAVVQIATFISLSSLNKSEDWVEHTYGVISDARQVGKLALDLESGKRGFLLTGDEIYMQHHIAAESQYEDTIKALKTQVAGNPSQVARLTDIEQLIGHWHETTSKPIVELRRKMDRQAAQTSELAAGPAVTMNDIEAMVRSAETNHLMDQVRTLIDEFISVEQELLKERRDAANLAHRFTSITLIGGAVIFFVIGGITLVTVLRNVFQQVGGEPAAIAAITNRIAKGDLSMGTAPHNETGILASVMVMLESLKKSQKEIKDRAWLSEELAGLDDVLRGTKKIDDLCEGIITYVARTLDVQVGTLSLTDKEGSRLVLAGSYAFQQTPDTKTEFAFGEGLIGQTARDGKRIVLKNTSGEGLTIRSALGEIVPEEIVCLPFLYQGEVKGVIELGSLHTFTELQLAFLDQTAERIAIAVNSARTREQMSTLLEESQSQAEELQAQQEELKAANEELELRSQELETQQEELRVTNEELEEKAAELGARQEENEDKSGES